MPCQSFLMGSHIFTCINNIFRLSWISVILELHSQAKTAWWLLTIQSRVFMGTFRWVALPWCLFCMYIYELKAHFCLMGNNLNITSATTFGDKNCGHVSFSNLRLWDVIEKIVQICTYIWTLRSTLRCSLESVLSTVTDTTEKNLRGK